MYVSPEQVQLIQSIVPIEDVIFATGYRVVGTGKSKGVNICPNCGRDYTHIKINSNKNLFNCYSGSCNFKGNQFHWIMKVENLSFPSAVVRVAEIGGINIEENEELKSFEAQKQKAFNLTVDFYRNHKHNYLYERGINTDTQEVFKVGFAPGGAALKKYLNDNGFNNDFLLNVGLIRLVQGKKLMDRFFNSVIIPDIRENKIHDFYARSVNAEIVSKHQYLYGNNTFIGSQTIEKGNDVYIVEAPIDAMSLYQITRKGVFSTGGASKFSNIHIFYIKKNSLKPIIAYDNDETGKCAAVDAIELLKDNELHPRALSLAKHKDINEILQNNAFSNIKLVDGNNFIYTYQLSKMPIDVIERYLKSVK